jgi:co-chaperonin GroES (HSP10)
VSNTLAQAVELLKTATTTQIEDAIDELAQNLFERNRVFQPLPPRVFVRVLKREQLAGGIWTPVSQNKILHEGLVIAVWKPYMRKGQYIRSELRPGDCVLFNHFAGVPVEGYDRDRYRVLKDVDFHPTNEGGIIARVQYDEARTRPQIVLSKWLTSMGSLRNGEVDTLVERIDRQFLLIDRDATGVTLSGA